MGKNDGKIPRCVSEVLFERFWVDFWWIFRVFLVLSMRKNSETYNVFVPFGMKNVLLATC